MNKELIALLESETNFIYDNFDEFTSEFIKCDFIDMYEVRFGTSEIRFVWITDKGQHISDSIDFNTYDNWKNKIIKIQ